MAITSTTSHDMSRSPASEQTVHRFRWPEARPTHCVDIHLAEVQGVVECVGVSVWGGTPPPLGNEPVEEVSTTRPVRTIDLRKVKVGELVEKAVAMLRTSTPAEEIAAETTTYVDGTPREVRSGRPTTNAHKASLRGSYGLAHYEEVARVYQDARRSRKPAQRAVADHFRIDVSVASQWIYRARGKGLLPQTVRGVASSGRPPIRHEKDGTWTAAVMSAGHLDGSPVERRESGFATREEAETAWRTLSEEIGS